MKKIFVFFMLVFLILTLVVTLAFAKSQYTIRLANVIPASDHIGKAFDYFAKLVSEKSNGSVEVLVFHGSQLGSGKETFEAAQSGFLEMASDSYANLVTLTPAFEPFHLPFIFETRKQELRVFKSERIRARIDEMLEKIGLKYFMMLEFGCRQICTLDKKILWPEDLKGMKLRASRSPLEIAAHKVWGATGITIDWVEAYDALRTGMVDGYTVTFDAVWSVKHYEVIKYIGELSFQVYGDVTVCNKEFWDNLPTDIKKILNEAARETETWHEKMLTDYVNMNIREMQEAGTEIYSYTQEQRKAFKEKAMTVWKEFEETTCPREYVDLILEERGPVDSEGWGYIY